MSNIVEPSENEGASITASHASEGWRAELVPESKRLSILPQLFGMRLMMLGENAVYNQMGAMCQQYGGGLWDYYALPNGAHYMVPTGSKQYELNWDLNGFSGVVSADAAGLIMTLMALSFMSFRDRTDTCAENFHKIRDLLDEHPEAALIFRAID